MINEALDTGEWLKEVLGDKLKSGSKDLLRVGDENRVRAIGQVDEGSLKPKWMSGEVGYVYSFALSAEPRSWLC